MNTCGRAGTKKGDPEKQLDSVSDKERRCSSTCIMAWSRERSDHFVVDLGIVMDWNALAGVNVDSEVVSRRRQQGFGERLVASAEIVSERDRMRWPREP
jgi:hypothetical protein